MRLWDQIDRYLYEVKQTLTPRSNINFDTICNDPNLEAKYQSHFTNTSKKDHLVLSLEFSIIVTFYY